MKRPPDAVAIQILRAIGVVPDVCCSRWKGPLPTTDALAPLLAVVISLAIVAVISNEITVTGMVMASTAALLLAIEEQEPALTEAGTAASHVSPRSAEVEVQYAHS